MTDLIKYGIIYKYTNNINSKIYVGQTVQTMARRHRDKDAAAWANIKQSVGTQWRYIDG